MDPRVTLLREFYDGLPRHRAKIETHGHGFAFLETLLGTDGATLEYGELTLTGLLHKYKLTNLSEPRLTALLHAHVAKECNVCLYFAADANRLFCFNLDNNHKTNNTAPLPAMDCAVHALRQRLRILGLEPLVVASGRGYHVWCRLAAPVGNDLLHDLMLGAGAHALAAVARAGHDHRIIKLNLYPDRRIHDVVSLRLFGTDHAKNRVFSRILTPEGQLLGEEASWAEFERHRRDHTIPVATVRSAHAAVLTDLPGVSAAPHP